MTIKRTTKAVHRLIMPELSITMQSFLKQRLSSYSLLVLLIVLALSFNPAYAIRFADESPASENYEAALSLIIQRRYTEAVASLRRIQRDFPQFSKIAAVQTRIAVLHEASSAGVAIDYYLQALSYRDSNENDLALASLATVLSDHPDTSLRDDALYLKAYIELMSQFEFELARTTLAQLALEFEEGAYQDSADYLDGIALEQLDKTALAIARFQGLRDRHTAASLPFGFNWPSNTVLSRYWFDRADKRLNMLDLQIASASVLRSAEKGSNDSELLVDVLVAGEQWSLVLWPSAMVRDTSWLDGSFSDSAPPATAFYEGEVMGSTDSWVRAVISDGEISGVFEVEGIEYKMQRGSLIGTLDYYQPRSEKNRSKTSPDSTSVDAVLGNDTQLIPDDEMLNLVKRQQDAHSDIQVVPLSIVIDREFDLYYGGRGLETALNELNVADGIYRKFDLALSLDKVQVFGSEDADPVDKGPATLETYLRSFREYRLNQSVLFSNSVLSYLFTGKDNTDLNLGIAWIGSICRTDGYDVGVTTPSSIGGLLLTHEIAHSLGAVHDDVTSCASETDKLMWPYLSTGTKSVFSDCSKDNLSGASSKSCLIDGVDIGVAVSGDVNEITVSLNNPDSSMLVSGVLILESSTLDVLLLPESCTQSASGGVECVIRDLSPNETRPLVVPLNSAVVNAQTIISVEMTSMNVLDYSKKNNSVEYSVMSGEQYQASAEPEQTPLEPDSAAGGSGGSGAVFMISLFAFLLSLARLFEITPPQSLKFRWNFSSCLLTKHY